LPSFVADPRREPDPWLERAAWLVVILSLWVNFHNILGTSLWNDEGYSFFASNKNFPTTIGWIETETQPPLYYLALTAWLGLGHGVLVLRSLSALAMSLGAVFVYLAARDLFGRKIAIVAVVLFVLNPYCVMWAQKARPYALQTMLVALSFWGFAGIVLADRARTMVLGSGVVAAFRTRTWSTAATDLRWFAYIVGGGLAMLTQHPAGFFVLGCNCAMLALLISRRAGALRLLINWSVAQLLLSGIWLLWFPEFLVQVANQLTPEHIRQSHAIFLVNPRQLWGILSNLLGVSNMWKVQPVFVALNAVIAAVALYSAVHRRVRSGFVFIVVLAPLAVCLAAYVLVHPVFGYVISTFCWLLVPYSMLLAFGIWSLRPGVLRWLALGVLLLGCARGLQNYYAETPPPLDAIAKYIGDHAQPGDAIIFSSVGSGQFGVAYYLQAADRSLAGVEISVQDDGLITTAAAALQHPRDWVVVPNGEVPAVDPAALEGTMRLGFDQPFGSVRVQRYDRRE
jgi:4-amino-4-deoxy-L-arabinose transferase-like glycosyltransferase